MPMPTISRAIHQPIPNAIKSAGTGIPNCQKSCFGFNRELLLGFEVLCPG
jgi:hypothetical protein